MFKEIEKMEMPSWLSEGDFNFEVRKVLNNSLFYPACGYDGSPVRRFMGNVYSFFYVNYHPDCQSNRIIEKIERRGFKGYHIIEYQILKPEDFGPFLCFRKYNRAFEEYFDHYRAHKYEDFFCEWFIFERDPEFDETHNPKRFSFVYMWAEAVTAYKDVYLANNIKPKIITIFEPGWKHPDIPGGYWEFLDKDKVFAKVVYSRKDLLPNYVVTYGRFRPNQVWDGYTEHIRENKWIQFIKLNDNNIF